MLEIGIYRTVKINFAVALAISNIKGFGRPKKEKHTGFGMLSCRVGCTGLEPVTPTLSR